MRKAISNDRNSASEWPLWEAETGYFDLLNVDPADLDTELSTRTVVILVPAYPESMRTAFQRQKKRSARMADEDLRNDIQATIAAVAMMQKELDRRTLAAKQKRLDDAARDIERTARKIEYAELKRRRGGRGFRQKAT
jgi:hypothetical protein